MRKNIIFSIIFAFTIAFSLLIGLYLGYTKAIDDQTGADECVSARRYILL